MFPRRVVAWSLVSLLHLHFYLLWRKVSSSQPFPPFHFYRTLWFVLQPIYVSVVIKVFFYMFSPRDFPPVVENNGDSAQEGGQQDSCPDREWSRSAPSEHICGGGRSGKRSGNTSSSFFTHVFVFGESTPLIFSLLQVVILHHMLSKATVKARPSVLWCYKKELGFSRCVWIHLERLNCLSFNCVKK